MLTREPLSRSASHKCPFTINSSKDDGPIKPSGKRTGSILPSPPFLTVQSVYFFISTRLWIMGFSFFERMNTFLDNFGLFFRMSAFSCHEPTFSTKRSSTECLLEHLLSLQLVMFQPDGTLLI